MTTETITVQLDTETANIYNAASDEERQKIQLLITLWLREFLTSKDIPLRVLMDIINEKAQAHGLTQEELELLTDAA